MIKTAAFGRNIQWQRIALIFAGVLLLLLSVTSLVQALVHNMALIVMRNAVRIQSEDSGVQHYPWLDIDHGELSMETARQWLASIASYELPGVSSRWASGRIQLAMGDFEAAADTLYPLYEEALFDPLLYRDVLVSLAYGGRPEEAIRLYTSAVAHRLLTSTDREAVAYALLSQGAEGDQQRAEAAIQAHSENIVANYLLWRSAVHTGDESAVSQYRNRLRTIVALPEGRLMWKLTLPVMVDLLEQEVWDQEKATAILAHLAWSYPDQGVAVAVLSELRKGLPQLAIASMYYGDIALRRGDTLQAITAYEHSLTLEPTNLSAIRRLASALEGQAQQTTVGRELPLRNAAEWYARLLAITPDDLSALKRLADICSALEGNGNSDLCSAEHLATIAPSLTDTPATLLLRKLEEHQPVIMLNQSWKAGWELQGITVDEAALVLGEPTDLFVFWYGSSNNVVAPFGQDWLRVNNRWVQVIENARSLLVNGGFEFGIGEKELPIGIESDLYGAPTVSKYLESDVARESTVLVLQNTEAVSLTSITSHFFPIAPNTLYLQGGWLRSMGGNAYFGRCWYFDHRRRFNRRDDYVGFGLINEEWQHYVGMAHPEKNAVEVQTWLLNYYSSGAIYFDDAWFLPIDSPPLSENIRYN